MTTDDPQPRPKPSKGQEVPEYDEKLGDDDDRDERQNDRERRDDENKRKGS